jgi:predicted ArsR family transcriptional regulator
MNEHIDTTRDTTDRATRHDAVSVNEAAIALGITPDSVRARLRRGSLAGEKRGTVWTVHLDDARRVTRHDTPRDVTRQRDSDRDELLAELRSDKHFLQEQLDRALRQLEDERQRSDVLQALGAGTASDTGTNAVGASPADDRDRSGVLAWARRMLGGGAYGVFT